MLGNPKSKLKNRINIKLKKYIRKHPRQRSQFTDRKEHYGC